MVRDIKNLTIGIMGPVEVGFLAEFLDLSCINTVCPKGLGGTPVNLLIKELLSRGYRVIVYSLDPDVEDEVIFQGENLKLMIGPFRKKRARDFFALERSWLINAVKRDDPDILHAHWTYEYALAAEATGIPCLVTGHDAPLNVLKLNFIPYRIARTFMAYKAIMSARHLSVVSPYVAEHLKKYFWYKRPIRIIPNGMPDSLFRIIRNPGNGDSITFATILVGWSGRKNGEKAIEAFAQLQREWPSAKLVMFGAGHGPGEAAEQWAIRSGMSADIEFAGQRSYADLINRLKSDVDVLVHPALEEAQPMTLIEAMALGVPVIGGETSGGVPWTLDNGNAGVLVDVTSSGQIADAMLKMARDTNWRKHLAAKGKEYARKRFHIGVVTDAYLAAYMDILSGRWT